MNSNHHEQQPLSITLKIFFPSYTMNECVFNDDDDDGEWWLWQLQTTIRTSSYKNLFIVFFFLDWFDRYWFLLVTKKTNHSCEFIKKNLFFFYFHFPSSLYYIIYTKCIHHFCWQVWWIWLDYYYDLSNTHTKKTKITKNVSLFR